MSVKNFIIALFFLISLGLNAKDFIIYSIVHDFPMYNGQKNLKRNFYLNIGAQQGVKPGTQLDVYRMISQLDPYESKKRYSYKVKIGELEVLHTEKTTAIAKKLKLLDSVNTPYFEIANFMIGDKIEVKITD